MAAKPDSAATAEKAVKAEIKKASSKAVKKAQMEVQAQMAARENSHRLLLVPAAEAVPATALAWLRVRS